MTQIERMLKRCENDIAKAQKGIDRCTKWNEKKEAKCVKLNCLWTTFEEFATHRDTDMTQPQYAAYVDWSMNLHQIEEYKHNLAVAQREYDKLQGRYTTACESAAFEDHVNNMENSWSQSVNLEEEHEKYLKWLARFKADCLKDGIKISEATANYINGLTASDKKFVMYINNGWTVRSNHSYTLRVDGETVFTSGLFGTGYRYLMK